MKLTALIIGLVALVSVGYADIVEVRHYSERTRVRYIEHPEVVYVQRPPVRIIRPAPAYYIERPQVVYVEQPKVKYKHHSVPKSQFYWGFGVNPYYSPVPFFNFGFSHYHR